MEIFESVEKLRKWRKAQSGSVGLVPTMGALHNGHLSLISRGRAENDIVVVSIFVNPTQFGANEDFDKYPRARENDLSLCENAGVSAVFMPSVSEIYPSETMTEILPPSALASVFEGAIRPGHFKGVLSVVLRLFALTTPQNAYFGKKDAQQLLIIQKMVKDLFLDIHIVPCEIVRDSDTLALSSRNAYLNAESRALALKIPRAIEKVVALSKRGIVESKALESAALAELKGLEVDYCNVVDFHLSPVESAKRGESVLLIAARVGGVRLLDNFWF